MTRMQINNNSYHDEEVHKNVQKRILESMGKADTYTIKNGNILKEKDSKKGYTVRLHFAEGKKDNSVVKEVQKILIETYINNIIIKGGK